MAQICGPSVTKVYVLTEAGLPIKGAALSLPDIKYDLDERYSNWRHDEDDVYFLKFITGKPYGVHRLLITSEGFTPAEFPITITEAQNQIFRVRLSLADEKRPAIVERLFLVWGVVKDETGVSLPGVNVMLVSSTGVKLAGRTGEDGYYMLEALGGSYKIEFNGPESLASVHSDKFVVKAGVNHWDAILSPAADAGSATGATCTRHGVFAGEFDCVLRRKGPDQ